MVNRNKINDGKVEQGREKLKGKKLPTTQLDGRRRSLEKTSQKQLERVEEPGMKKLQQVTISELNCEHTVSIELSLLLCG